jgi:hypothetical protein
MKNFNLQQTGKLNPDKPHQKIPNELKDKVQDRVAVHTTVPEGTRI